MKVLGKVWKDKIGLTLEFYIKRKRSGWWKVNTIKLSRCNKRFNLLRLFTLFATQLEYPFDLFGERNEKLMWERTFEVDIEMCKKKFGKAVES